MTGFKRCPLRTKAEDLMDLPCLRDECGLWDPALGECSFVSIAANLHVMAGRPE
jgi:hypothetical protein